MAVQSQKSYEKIPQGSEQHKDELEKCCAARPGCIRGMQSVSSEEHLA